MTQKLFKDPWRVTQEADCHGWMHYEFIEEPRIKMQYASFNHDDNDAPPELFLTWGYTGLCATTEFEPFEIGHITDMDEGAFKHTDPDVKRAILLECATVLARGYLRQWNNGKPRDVISKKTLTFRCAWLMHELSSGVLGTPYGEKPYWPNTPTDLHTVVAIPNLITNITYYVAYTGRVGNTLVLLDATGGYIKRLRCTETTPYNAEGEARSFLKELGIIDAY